MRPNILLITADQLRGDCMSALGHPDVKTPFLDTMMNHGAAFTNAYSATPTCVPARVALFTGQSQSAHGRVGYKDCTEWEYENTLPKAFADAGYHTQCVGKMHVWPPRKLMGFHNVVLHDGFLPHRKTDTVAKLWWDRVDDYLPYLRQHCAYMADINDTGIDCNSWVARSWPLPEHTHPTNWTVTQSIDFLRRRDTTKPFFLWTSFLAPHPPLLPPMEYLQQYLSKTLAEPITGDWNPCDREGHPDIDCFEGQLGKEELQTMRAGYYGLITHLDHQIGRLLRTLKDEGLRENTVILVTSDHGEMLGDHGMFRKNQPFNGSVKVPLIIYDPGKLLKLKEGQQCREIAELRDVFPTLAAIAGVEVPSTVEGVNLLNCLRREEKSRDYLHGEHTAQQDLGRSSHYIVTKEFKYIWNSDNGLEYLFDLLSDPEERHDISQELQHRQVLEKMRRHLIDELTGREEGYTDGITLLPGKTPRVILERPMPEYVHRKVEMHET